MILVVMILKKRFIITLTMFFNHLVSKFIGFIFRYIEISSFKQIYFQTQKSYWIYVAPSTEDTDTKIDKNYFR